MTEKQVRNVKEFKLPTIGNMRLKCGTNNRKNPKVIYVEGKMWIKPLREFDYEEGIENVRKTMHRRLKQTLFNSHHFDRKYIFDFSFNTGTMRCNVGKFMLFQIFLKQNETEMAEVNRIKERVEEEILPLMYDLVDDFNNNGFELTIHKRSVTP